MKLPSIILFSFLLAMTANGKCSVVEVISPQPSTQRVKILTLHNGIALKNVKIEVFDRFDSSAHPTRVLQTNKRGIAKVRLSPSGHYRVSASTDSGLHADLYLDVAKGTNESLFPLDLDLGQPLVPTFQNMIAVAENGASARTQQFAGVVVDPAGALIKRARIQVFKKGSGGKNVLTSLESDEQGHFSSFLRAGSYTAVFMSPGFKTHIIVIEVSPDANERDLQVPLQIGACT